MVLCQIPASRSSSSSSCVNTAFSSSNVFMHRSLPYADAEEQHNASPPIPRAFSWCFGNGNQVGQHPLACLKASRSWSNHRHLGRGIGLDDDGIEQSINPRQWIRE